MKAKQIVSVTMESNKFCECISPIKLMMIAPNKMGNCTINDHLVSKPKKIKIPPRKCAEAT